MKGKKGNGHKEEQADNDKNSLGSSSISRHASFDVLLKEATEATASSKHSEKKKKNKQKNWVNERYVTRDTKLAHCSAEMYD